MFATIVRFLEANFLKKIVRILPNFRNEATAFKSLGIYYEQLYKKYGNKLTKALSPEAIVDLIQQGLPELNSFNVLLKATNMKPQVLINTLKTNPEAIKLTEEAKEEFEQSLIADAETSELSSSWLAYGTFVPLKNNWEIGKLILTTKSGVKFETGNNIFLFQWHAMIEGSPGTILWKIAPKKTWRKVN